MRLHTLLACSLLGLATSAFAANDNKSIYHKDWIDFNKNNTKDVYEDPTAPIDDRVSPSSDGLYTSVREKRSP